MNDWKDLTVQVLHTIDRAHGRLEVGRQAKLKKELATDRILVEKIRSNYETGNLIAIVQPNEEPIFQNLVRNLSSHQRDLELGEPIVVIENFKGYLRSFFDVGPHGPGGGKPGITGQGPRGGGGGFGGGQGRDRGEREGQAGEADTHGSGKGKP